MLSSRVSGLDEFFDSLASLSSGLVIRLNVLRTTVLSYLGEGGGGPGMLPRPALGNMKVKPGWQ